LNEGTGEFENWMRERIAADERMTARESNDEHDRACAPYEDRDYEGEECEDE